MHAAATALALACFLLSTVGGLILGVVLMLASWPFFHEYFRRRPEVAPEGILAEPARPAG